MPTTINFKPALDMLVWREVSALYGWSAGAATVQNYAGGGCTCDPRTDGFAYPYMLYYDGGKINRLGARGEGWSSSASTTGGSESGSAAIFLSDRGKRSTFGAGSTTTYLNIGAYAGGWNNCLANKGDGVGYKIRVIGNAALSSGKTEEVVITGYNHSTGYISVSPALSWSPVAGDSYEIRSGKLYTVGTGVWGASSFRSWDPITEVYANLSFAGTPAGGFAICSLVGMCEDWVPYNRLAGEGFFGILTATASGATSLTGQAAGGDAGVAADEWRNFQIRIVEDTATPTAVGQRRNITTHTIGASPIYTVAAWTVQPSATAKYVIEYNGDRMLFFSSTTATAVYNYTFSTDTWSSAIWAAKGVSFGTIQNFMATFAYGCVDPLKLTRPSQMYVFRPQSNAVLDIFDIAGAATGTWTETIQLGTGENAGAFAGGSCGFYNPFSQQGRYYYMTLCNGNYIWRFDLLTRHFEPYTPFDPEPTPNGITYRQNLVVVPGFVDGGTRIPAIFHNLGSAGYTNRWYKLDILY